MLIDLSYSVGQSVCLDIFPIDERNLIVDYTYKITGYSKSIERNKEELGKIPGLSVDELREHFISEFIPNRHSLDEEISLSDDYEILNHHDSSSEDSLGRQQSDFRRKFRKPFVEKIIKNGPKQSLETEASLRNMSVEDLMKLRQQEMIGQEQVEEDSPLSM